MALIQVNYLSQALFRIVPLNVILPADRFDADTNHYLNEKGHKYKTLYLLHGLLIIHFTLIPEHHGMITEPLSEKNWWK